MKTKTPEQHKKEEEEDPKTRKRRTEKNTKTRDNGLSKYFMFVFYLHWRKHETPRWCQEKNAIYD